MDDEVSAYLREIGRIPLLSAHDEHALAVMAARGEKAARTRLIEANLRLVVEKAKAYRDRGVPLLDLIQEGNIGLIKGIDHFDPLHTTQEGTFIRLSTYVSWWIKQQLLRALPEQGRTIRLPVYIAEQIFAVHRAERALSQLQGRDATTEEVAAALDVSPERVEELRGYDRPTLSLDEPGTGEGELPRGATLAAPAEEEAPIGPEEIRTLLARAKLGPRETRILQLRFGLLDGRPRTLVEVGREFGRTRERMRQIELAAMSKLRGAA